MYLFSKTGQQLLESLFYTDTLFAFDFDGTLSKIVRNPEDAVITPAFSDMIQQLNRQVPVAVISGRSLDDLKSKFDFRPTYLVGNHGLEGLSDVVQNLDIFKSVSGAWKSQAQFALATEEFQDGGIEIEDKEYSLAFHYRKSRTKGLAKRNLLKIADALEPPPRIVLGKCVINIIPNGGPHKGMALLQAMSDAGAKKAFYIGDDYTDEDVFALPDSRIFTVRVGQKQDSNAKFFVRNQTEVGKVISTILSYFSDQYSKSGADAK